MAPPRNILIAAAKILIEIHHKRYKKVPPRGLVLYLVAIPIVVPHQPVELDHWSAARIVQEVRWARGEVGVEGGTELGLERGLKPGPVAPEESVGGPVFERAETLELGAGGHVAVVGEEVGVQGDEERMYCGVCGLDESGEELRAEG